MPNYTVKWKYEEFGEESLIADDIDDAYDKAKSIIASECPYDPDEILILDVNED